MNDKRAEEVVKIFKDAGMTIEIGSNFSVKGQIAQLLNGVDVLVEQYARLVERRAEVRFQEHGHTETDTNAGYYSGAGAESYEAQDEECEDIAAAIRAHITL